ncbi:MAG: SusD/RagB family nutrient-binding outer membrane lipoprotein [Gemmatimonadetes bacterium]|nr:SusD/RagB family nutrient-binding outer membrane lipoprotein [Gemmatimonadota bacterium]
MRNLTQRVSRAVCAAALAASLGACSNFIDNVPTNDNVVSNASVAQLLVATQLRAWLFNEGHVARTTSIWLNQMAGVDRQFASLEQYVYSEDEWDSEMTGTYTIGGLVDLRLARAKADSLGLTHTSAILKIHEAFLVGMASSMWGDLPYSQALGGGAQPKSPVDKQEAIYAAVQTLLDQAIAGLAGAASPSDAPLLGDRDFSFGGDAAAWSRVAYTLKARFYMHWVEAQGVAATQAAANTACGGNCVAKALAAAQNGINTAAGDWESVHSSAATEANWWYQFMNERSGYLAAGTLMVDSLRARGDTELLQKYFIGTPATIQGSKPGQSNTSAAQLNITDSGVAGNSKGIEIVTCAENQFILAEALYRSGAANASIYAAINAGARCLEARYGLTTGSVHVTPGLTGAALLHEIMMQKYFALFLNMESMNDYKRTCEPNVAAAVKAGSPIQNDPIPARLLYGQSERQANPNLSAPGTGNNGSHNTNDPISCATVTGLPGA